MRQSNKRYIQLRYLLVVGMMLFFSMFIVWAMFKNSVIYAGKWNAKADSVLLKITDIPPERGKLLADDGNVLAANLQFYVVRFDWFIAAHCIGRSPMKVGWRPLRSAYTLTSTVAFLGRFVM